MNETSAWQKFYKSGKIADYLAYTNVKEKPPEENAFPKEENDNVYKDRRSSYKGTDNR